MIEVRLNGDLVEFNQKQADKIMTELFNATTEYIMSLNCTMEEKQIYINSAETEIHKLPLLEIIGSYLYNDLISESGLRQFVSDFMDGFRMHAVLTGLS